MAVGAPSLFIHQTMMMESVTAVLPRTTTTSTTAAAGKMLMVSYDCMICCPQICQHTRGTRGTHDVVLSNNLIISNVVLRGPLSTSALWLNAADGHFSACQCFVINCVCGVFITTPQGRIKRIDMQLCRVRDHDH